MSGKSNTKKADSRKRGTKSPKPKKSKQAISRRPSDSHKARKKDFQRNWFAYLIFIPVFVWYIVFCYLPMWGILIAFKDYKPLLGFFKSKWVGLKNFKDFLQGFMLGDLFPTQSY